MKGSLPSERIVRKKWKVIEEIANFSRMSGEHRTHVAVSLERAEHGGKTYYRWAAYHSRSPDRVGEITEDMPRASDDGLAYAMGIEESQ